MTVEASFTATGDISDPLDVGAGRQGKLAVAGTFAGKVEMQRKIGSAGWQVVGTLLGAGAITVDEGIYRAVARSFTSGQADVTLSVLTQAGAGAGTAGDADTITAADEGDQGDREELTLLQVYNYLLSKLDGSVTAAKLADDAVETAKILDGNVTLAKLASIAAATFLGNNTGDAAAPIALTVAEVLAALGIVIDTYTPGGTGVANVDAVVPGVTQYLKVGNAVIVAGTVAINPTTTLVTTQVDLDLPVASDLAAIGDCVGVGTNSVSNGITAFGQIFGETTGNKARLQFVPVDVNSRTWSFIFMYRVL